MNPSEIRVTGHFGEWMQGRLGPDGPVVLITLPCPRIGVTVRRAGPGSLVLNQRLRVLEDTMASAMLATLGLPAEGAFEVWSDLPRGSGTGTSTAGLLALAYAAGAARDDNAGLIRACLAIEGASDPLMLTAPDTHLWQSRRGESLGRSTAPPVFDIIGGTWGSPQPTDPEDIDFPDIRDLIKPWSRACSAGDLERVAELASRSAARTTALRGPADDPTAPLAANLGALGHVRAHTGSVRGLLFAPGTIPDRAEAALVDAGFAHVLRFRNGPEP